MTGLGACLLLVLVASTNASAQCCWGHQRLDGTGSAFCAHGSAGATAASGLAVVQVGGASELEADDGSEALCADLFYSDTGVCCSVLLWSTCRVGMCCAL